MKNMTIKSNSKYEKKLNYYAEKQQDPYHTIRLSHLHCPPIHYFIPILLHCPIPVIQQAQTRETLRLVWNRYLMGPCLYVCVGLMFWISEDFRG